MTYHEIIEIFGDDSNLDAAILKLAAVYPDFTGKDLIDVFKTISDNYHGIKIDIVISKHNNSIGFEYYSDRILRTIYQIMFFTDYWDMEILFQPEFINSFTVFYNDFKFKNISLPRRQIGGYVPNTVYELLDKLDDFRDSLNNKIRKQLV